MISMIIVDDNNRDRRIIQEVIDWASYGIRIEGAAGNGREALELAERFHPDLVISDISMPSMNGIELAQELKIRFPNAKLVFMSWYNDFEFAKSAVNLNVYGYVMKPIVPEELVGIVLNVLGIHNREMLQKDAQSRLLRQIEESLPIVHEEFFRELLFGGRESLPNLKRKAEFLRLDYDRFALAQVMVIQIEGYDHYIAEKDVTQQYELSYYIKESVEAMQADGIQTHFVRVSPSDFAVIAFSRLPAQSPESQLIEAATELYTALGSRFGVSVMAGISECSAGIQGLTGLYRQCARALETKFYSRGTPIILYREIAERAAKEGDDQKVNVAGLAEEVKEAVHSGSDEEINRLVLRYLPADRLKESGIYHKSVAFTIANILQMMLVEAGQPVQEIFGDSLVAWDRLNGFSTIAGLQDWCRRILSGTARCLGARSESRDGQIVSGIKEIVKARYHEQITVDDIVDVAYISARQANKIFKRQTGLTIFDYLVEHRVQMAKALLKNPYSRIYQVAEQVGYQNKSHFCLVFKKVTGLTPAEYRNNPV